ncbi:MAG: hypothetical protein ACKVOQ_15915 [Cyclobacteriaceae bacterium]
METRDLVVTPIIAILIFVLAFLIRPYVTDSTNGKYFLPALAAKIIGALVLGVIYQFYYDGGDTYNYHTYGSRYIWEAFIDSPSEGLSLLFSDGNYEGNYYEYASRIIFFADPASFFVVRLAAIFDLFTFSTYSSTAICFAVLSFIGMWMFFLTFYKKYPDLHWRIALAILFIPSVFFWGSGLLKDTLMVACLGVVTYQVDKLFFERKISFLNVFLLIISLWCIFSVKKFILQAFLPAVFLWIYLTNLKRISSVAVRVFVFPLIMVFLGISVYYSIVKVGEGDSKYAVENIAKTARVTAYDIRFQTGKDAGSGYTLGELDDSFGTMLKLAPQAINVSLFRPYLWEVKNPLMLLSSLESMFFLILTLTLVFRYRWSVVRSFKNPDISFSLVFSLMYAFAVGISSFNFGTLARYKIPLMPFYALAIILIFYENRPKTLVELDKAE